MGGERVRSHGGEKTAPVRGWASEWRGARRWSDGKREKLWADKQSHIYPLHDLPEPPVEWKAR